MTHLLYSLAIGFLLACQNQNAAPPVVTPGPSAISQDTIPPPDSRKVKDKDRQGDKMTDEEISPEASAPSAVSPGKKTDALKKEPAANGFTDLATLKGGLSFDIRYATTNNFTKAKIYDCPRCLLRPAAAHALLRAHQALQRKGMGLKLFDCYRPRPYQQRLWDKVPNPDYVTPPVKGSMHSRGAAVDLTIVDAQGQELDMGTPYDFFGKEAHYDFTALSAKVLANRRLLRQTMEEAGFKGIRTEWWHFSYQKQDFPLSDYVWPCDQ